LETITKHVLSAKEAADYLGVHINTISKHIEIPRFRIGGRVLFRKEKLDQFILENEQTASIKKSRGSRCRI